jgi:hypothetical protein
MVAVTKEDGRTDENPGPSFTEWMRQIKNDPFSKIRTPA